MFNILRSKKGFTFVEAITVIIIMGILTAVAIPVFKDGLDKKRREDCRNQCIIISTLVEQAMYGMIDNGKKQPKINFDKIQGDHRSVYKEDGIPGNSDDAYDGKYCFVLWYDKFNANDSVYPEVVKKAGNQLAMTLADLRGGYRPYSNDDDPQYGLDYDAGCEQGYYLKKKIYADHMDMEDDTWVPAKKFYTFLQNEEIPVCPFAKVKYSRSENIAPEYMYFIFEDGTVLCSCPQCH